MLTKGVQRPRGSCLASLKAHVTDRLLAETGIMFLSITENAVYPHTQLLPGRGSSDSKHLQRRQFLVVQVWLSKVPRKSPAH